MTTLRGQLCDVLPVMATTLRARVRATVACGWVQEAAWPAFANAVRALADRDVEVVRWGEEGADLLAATLNGSRDRWVSDTRQLIILAAKDERGVRELLSQIPDLNQTINVELAVEADHDVLPWDELRRQLRELAQRRSASVDLTLLLVGETERTSLSPEEMYLDLLAWPEQTSRRYLVAGPPGAGKTTALLHLLRTLVEPSGPPPAGRPCRAHTHLLPHRRAEPVLTGPQRRHRSLPHRLAGAGGHPRRRQPPRPPG
jgi:hypothetical protein